MLRRQLQLFFFQLGGPGEALWHLHTSLNHMRQFFLDDNRQSLEPPEQLRQVGGGNAVTRALHVSRSGVVCRVRWTCVAESNAKRKAKVGTSGGLAQKKRKISKKNVAAAALLTVKPVLARCAMRLPVASVR